MKILKKLYPIIILLIFISCNGQKTPCQDLINKVENKSINKFIDDNSGESSYTALGYAIKCGNVEIVKNIINKGTDINIAKSDGIYEYDALFVAIERKNYSIVQYLLSKGSDPNKIYNEDGLTPLSLSVINQDLEITKLLISKGANVNGVGNHGGDYTLIPLKEALNRENKDIVKLLIEYGAITNELDKGKINTTKIIDIRGSWSTFCGNSITFTIKNENDILLPVMSNQIYIKTKLEKYQENNYNLYFVTTDDLGSGGIRLNWDNFSKDKPITEIKLLEGNAISFRWLGFYDKVEEKMIFPDCEFNLETNANPSILKRCN